MNNSWVYIMGTVEMFNILHNDVISNICADGRRHNAMAYNTLSLFRFVIKH